MRLIATLLAALIGCKIAQRLRIPSAVMLGAMLGAGVYNILFTAQLPSDLKIFTQGIAGAFIGMQFQRNDFIKLKKLAFPLGLLLVLFTLEPLLIGFLMNRIFNLDLNTALFSCVPGGVSDVSIIAMEMGADSSKVALLQTSRQLFVLLCFPLWISFYTARKKEDGIVPLLFQEDISKRSVPTFSIAETAGFLSLVFLFSALGKISGISAGSLIFSMLFTLAVNCFIKPVHLHSNIKKTGQFFAGALIGTSITRSTILALPSLIGPTLLLLIGYWLLNTLYGALCFRLRILDRCSAMFSACPAGASEMALAAADLSADLASISLLQVIRRIYVVTILPQIISMLL